MSALLLLSCGEDVRPLMSNPPAADPDPRTDPLVDIAFNGFDPETTVLRFSEGQTVTFEIDTLGSEITTASLVQTSGPLADFGTMTINGESSGGDLNVGNGTEDVRFFLQDVEGPREAIFPLRSRARVEFVMPSVTTRTNMTFRFQAADPSQSRTRFIPVIIEDDAAAITLTGRVSKGLISNTKVKLFSVDGFIDDFLNPRQIVEPVQINAAGIYNFTLLPAIDFEELLLYKIEGDGADMVCDAPHGCGTTPFGQTFEVEDDIDLRAYLRVPQFGTTQTVNVNILTTLSARTAQDIAEGFERVDAEDVARAQREVADIFRLPNQNFTEVPFVDVTRQIVSRDENAVRVAMIGGGVLGAAFAQSDPDDDDDYLEEIKDFIDDFSKGRVDCQDAPSQTTISVEDVISSALDLSRINGSIATQEFFRIRLTGIRTGLDGCNFSAR